MARFVPALALLAVVAVTGACSSDTSDDEAERGGSSTNTDTATVPSADVSSDAPAEPVAADPPLELDVTTLKTDGCAERPRVHDWAWMDVQWKAHQDLENISVSLVDARGVTLIVSPINVPPVNFGGRIDESGEYDWENRAGIGDSRFVEWMARGTLDFWSPMEDETGMLVLHLRVTGRGTFTGVKVDYTTLDGEPGSVTGATDYDLRHARDCGI